MQNLFRNMVMVLCLIALGAFGAWLYLRPQIPRGEMFTDGESQVSSRQIREEVRLVLWNQPETLSEAFRTGDAETDPFIDQEHGRTYFALGEAGVDQELWVAEEAVDGELRIHPLRELNSSYDESSPAFHNGYLYFTSNRPGGAGGYDLYRSRWQRDEFQPPENLGSMVNTEADEVDPTFRADTGELCFASNRDPVVGVADYDLYRSNSDGVRFASAVALDGPATPYDERSPTFDADGDVLVFSSNRAQGLGGHDLYRAIRQNEQWIQVQNLDTLNTIDDETGPSLADDGFTIYFSSDRLTGTPDLFVARTEELYALPGGGLSLLDLTILFLLALVALLAYLARKWSALDVIYKCILISLIVHLLLLWLTRRIDIENEPSTLGPDEKTYQIKLLNDVLDAVAQMEDRERGDQVEMPAPQQTSTSVQRSQSRASDSPATAAAFQPMERSSTATDSEAPSRSATGDQNPQFAAESTVNPIPVLKEAYERISGEAPSMPVQTASVDAPNAAVEAGATREQTSATSNAPTMTPQGIGTLTRAEIASPKTARRTDGSQAQPSAVAKVVTVMDAPADRVVVQRPEASSLDLADTEVTSMVARASTEDAPVRGVVRANRDASPAAVPSETPLVRADRAANEVAESGPSRQSDSQSRLPSESLSLAEAAKIRVPDDQLPVRETESAPALALAAPEIPTASTSTTPTTTGELSRYESSAAASPLAELSPRPTMDSSMAPATRDAPIPSMNPRGSREQLAKRDLASVEMTGPSDRVNDAAPAATAQMAQASRSLVDPTSAWTPAPQPRALESSPERLSQSPAQSSDASGFVAPRETLARSGASTTVAPQRRSALTPPRMAPRPSLRELAVPMRDRSQQAGKSRTPAPVLASPALLADSPSSIPIPVRRSTRGPRRANVDVSDPSPSPVADSQPLTAMIASSPKKREASPKRLSNLYDRRTGPSKNIALREGGGSAETEKAVLAGLRYLASIQRQNGSFGDLGEGSDQRKYRDVRIGKTGLAALAFLGAGHTHQSKTEFSDNVRRSLEWIIREQDRTSGHFGESDGYSHGIATYALAECYAMSRDRALLMPLVRAVRQILRVQVADEDDSRLRGGWRYYYSTGPGYDHYPRASLSSWQVMALKSAEAGGVPIPEDAMKAARSYFRNGFDRRYGYFRYNHDPEWLNSAYRTLPASTPASMFVLNLLDVNDDPILDSGASFIMTRLPSGYRYRGDAAFAQEGAGNIYYWYYGTLAMFFRGGMEWRQWNDAMKSTLLPAQQPDGSWRPLGAYAERFAGDDRKERTYTTALAVLSLEVYYRYFTPLLQRQHSRR